MLRGSAGEWEDMRYAIAGMMNFNMFGIPMVGADVCGSFVTNVT
jgi:alpha-glucosidase (family GH31 glycosyl hydrolase)